MLQTFVYVQMVVWSFNEAWIWQGMEILVRKKSDQAGTEQFTSLVDTAVYTRYA